MHRDDLVPQIRVLRAHKAAGLSDLPKLSAGHAIRAFQKMGMEVHLMTGDSDATARAIAEQVGITHECVWSRMSPQGKARKVTELLEKTNGGVAMVILFLFKFNILYSFICI